MTRLHRNLSLLLIPSLLGLWLMACGLVPATPEMATATAYPVAIASATVQATRRLTPTQAATDTATPSASVTPAVCPPGSGENVIISATAAGETIVEMFEPQILAYLNARGDAQGLQAALGHLVLTDSGGQDWQAQAQVLSADVTGDTTPEVVVELLFYVEGQFADGALFVFRCQAGQYVGGAVTPLGGQLFSGRGPEPVVRAIQDMNGNGTPDIAISYDTVIGTHANYTREFRILEWDGRQFVDLIKSGGNRPHAAEVLNGDGVIRDIDEDGILELELVHGAGHGPDAGTPASPRTDVWAWDGEAFTLVGW